MIHAEKNPVIDYIDTLMTEHPHDVYPRDNVFRPAPNCLRFMVNGFDEPLVMTRRHPAQVTTTTDGAPNDEYDACHDASVGIPPSFFGISGANEARVVSNSPTDPDLRLYGYRVEDLADPWAEHSDSLPAGDKISAVQQEALLNLLRSARIIGRPQSFWQIPLITS